MFVVEVDPEEVLDPGAQPLTHRWGCGNVVVEVGAVPEVGDLYALLQDDAIGEVGHCRKLQNQLELAEVGFRR